MLEGTRGLILLKDAGLRKTLSEAFAGLGGFAYTYRKEEELLKALDKDKPHFVVVDGQSASEREGRVIQKIRDHKNQGQIPVVVLSETLALSTKRLFIEKGADRVVRYKMDPSSLALELFALLRRSHSYLKSSEILEFGDIALNTERQQAHVAGRDINLTGIEFKVFKELLTKRGEVVTREKLTQSFLTLRNTSDRTLDVHINALRKKLGQRGHNLTTIRGRGYMFRD